MERPQHCRYPEKVWMKENQAIRKGEVYGMNAYKCYDHWHIGHGRRHKARA